MLKKRTYTTAVTPGRPLLMGFLALFACVYTNAAARDSDDFDVHPSYVMDQWTVEDGLPVNNVVDILQAGNGYLWLATFDGMVRFDGIDFKVYQSERYPGLPSNRILTVTEARDGSIWLTTEQGFVVYFKDGAFYRVGRENGLNGNLASEFIFKDHKGVLWIASDQGISTFDGETLAPYLPELIKGDIQNVFVETSGAVWYRLYDYPHLFRVSEEQVQQFDYPLKSTVRHLPIYEDPLTGWIWVGKIAELYVYRNNTLEYHSDTAAINSTSDVVMSVSDLHRDRQGSLWLVNERNAAHVWNETEQQWEKQLQGRYATRRISFFRVWNENLWFLSGQYIFEKDTEILHTTDQIYAYHFDKEGSLWLGTKTEGLVRLKQNPFKTYTEKDGMPWNNVYTIIEDYKGNIWAGTYRSGVGVIHPDGMVKTVPIENSAWGGFITSLYMGRDRSIYTSAVGYGLAWIQPGEPVFRMEPIPGPGSPAQIQAFYEDGNGDLWVGSENGLFIGNRGAWRRIEDQGFRDFRVRAITEAPDGSLWLGTNGAGIVRYHKNAFTFYGTDQGFTSNLFRSFYISDIRTEQEYTLWVGTEDLGLVRVDIQEGEPNLQSLTRYGTRIGLLDYAIHSIQEDDFGYFWMNTNRGIFRIEKAQLEQYHRGEIETIKGISFTESDGLLNREGNGSNQSPGITASDGRIWFANQAGAVVFDPADFTDIENERVPPVVIEEIKTATRSILSSENQPIKLHKQERDFEITFTALSLIAPERNNFRYRLLGFNDEWIETDGQRSAVYTNIPNGSYTFEVTASNNTGKWNPDPVRLAFTIAPYFYETAWFNLSVLGLLGLMMVAGYQWRVRLLKRSETQLKEQVELRTHQLKKEKEKTDEQAERLRELDKSKTRFFTNISHELRTPLTLIMSPLQQMLSENGSRYDAQTREEFERMLRNSDRLLRLIDQTLDLNRLEQGKVRLKVQKMNLRDFVEDIADLFTFVGAEKEIDIHFTSQDDDFELYADPDKLDKIVANILSNAIKFTPDGGSIDITVSGRAGYVEVTITDSGIGIAPENLERIFDRFYQVDASETRFQEGSGIGLSLVKDFMDLHHGELLVESELQAGTTFILRFKKGRDHFSKYVFSEETEETGPGQPEKTIANEIAVSPPSEGEETFSQDRLSLLIVEDNADMRDFIKKILQDEYRILTAANGEEGMNMVAEKLPDLIVADIMMPKIDGITFNRMLKQEPETASIPLIFLTAKSTRDNKIEGFDEGGDAYLTKPFYPDMLKAQIRNLITSRYRLREILAEASPDTHQPGTASSPAKTDPFVQEVLDVLARHFTDTEFSVSRLSKALYMDRSQVLRKLKEATGLSPSACIKKYRMEKAAELLQDGTENISELAYAVGFKSLSYFSSCFKEHFGQSPSEMLKASKESVKQGN